MADVMIRMASYGRQLYEAVTTILRERYAAGERAASIAVGGLFAAALGFALSSLLAFWILHRRLGEPVGELADVVARVSAGDDTARAKVRGDHEPARLGAGLNAML